LLRRSLLILGLLLGSLLLVTGLLFVVESLADDAEPERQDCTEKECLSDAGEELVEEVVVLPRRWSPDVAPEQEPDANEHQAPGEERREAGCAGGVDDVDAECDDDGDDDDGGDAAKETLG
jgi:hypothetical protein